GDIAVVREQLALRDALVRPEGLVEVRQPQRPSATTELRLDAWALHRHVVADTEEHGRAQPALARLLGERDLRGERGLDPGHVAGSYARHARGLDERRRRPLERRKERPQ